MMTVVIKVATDFSRFPFGRYRSQGQHSGEQFRDQFLLAPLRKGEAVQVDFDGTSGLSPSFLEEAFGGLVRLGLEPARVLKLLKIKSDEDPSYIDEVTTYVTEAKVTH